MSQVSGSISLDVAKIERKIEEIVHLEVGHEVNRQVTSALHQISADIAKVLKLLQTEIALSPEDTATVINRVNHGEIGEALADELSAQLIDAGYAIVAVTGAALEAAARRQAETEINRDLLVKGEAFVEVPDQDEQPGFLDRSED